ncbi:MAG: bifunctional 4-hydroxy-2-oxoglutarate aldolase/2-dehydro-3-deoxy-phosphogluconate aldolase [Bacillota bacterium]|nr:bifunctional 4-hydroxy-2-oxoglutarate aldolase/2-dehydro-3-deoxy-phosphogluconate aldolase [Bacillota bacterium]
MYEELFAKHKVVPVVVIEKIEDAIPTLKAMLDGGVSVAEVTFRTECAEEAIRRGCKEFPEMDIGAGTVINGEQCERAIKAGAKFIVGPGTSDEVMAVCKKHNIPYLPGCITPTEIMHALANGYDIIKFFPAGNYGGLKTMKALSGPFPQVKFLPTGGISLENLREYLDWNKIVACGGSWMMKGDIKANCEEVAKIEKEYIK